MARREKVIAQSVASSIVRNHKERGCLGSLPAFFWLYWLDFHTIRPDLFEALRASWSEDDEMYHTSFTGTQSPEPLGDMGYSGSTFFKTHDDKYLVKSIPRSFENTFFRDDLVLPYAEYMVSNPSSLLIHIHDFLECTQTSLGTLLGTAPTHHIVMENLKPATDAGNVESWDLKPMSYFYPERDVAGGALSTEATKSKLPDEFKDTVVLTPYASKALIKQIEDDTALLAQCKAVDYSLFLVRMPADATAPTGTSDGEMSWRKGVRSADGKHVYRAAILDFFWAKHKAHAKAMSGLIRGYNVIDKQGDMSITAEPEEYRLRWLDMCKKIVEVQQ